MYFNPRPPWGGRRQASRPVHLLQNISIHALRGEGDRTKIHRYHRLSAFQSTPSVGRATFPARSSFLVYVSISIHALRGEGDLNRVSVPLVPQHFNPRPPWGGRRESAPNQYKKETGNFNPRPPWGGRRYLCNSSMRSFYIFQSTPSVGRATVKPPDRAVQALVFQSTPSVGRATKGTGLRKPPPLISIHALRGEGDIFSPFTKNQYLYFNPRPPWGGRLQNRSRNRQVHRHFNPRPPWGGRRRLKSRYISIK